MNENKLSNAKAVMVYFSEGLSGRKVTMKEMKDLTPEEREELGEMAKEAITKGWK